MDKLTIIKEKQHFIQWVSSLKNVSKQIWPKRIQEEDNRVAHLVASLNSLDYFLVTYRLPYLVKNQPLPQVEIDSSTLTRKAKETLYGLSKSELIDRFIIVRQRFLALLVMLPEHRFTEPFPMDPSKTLSDYFAELIQHDYNHKKEIEQIINKTA